MDEYLILTTEISVRTGPTTVGKEGTNGNSQELMEKLGAKLKESNSTLGKTYWESPNDISELMHRAKRLGYELTSATGVGQTFIVVMELDSTE